MKPTEHVAPGENWFCYWRTSASLWEAKLGALQVVGAPIVIPLYWGLHSETGESFDFGETRPEADLARLHRSLQKIGADSIWLLPLTPAPFMPNGGLPAGLARHPAHDVNGMTQAFLDGDGTIHKLHSFYDPRVYQAYRKWCWQLGQVLTQRSVAVPMKGLRSYWVGASSAHSYLEDHSATFRAGFVRYLKQQNLPVRTNDEGVELPQLKRDEERTHVARYRKLIADLYGQTAAESLGGHWIGEQSVAFVGGAPQDIFARSSELWPHQVELMQDLWTAMDWNLLPSSALLAPANKTGVLAKFLKEHLSAAYLRQAFQQSMAEDTLVGHFTPLVFLEILWEDERALEAPEYLAELGLLPHLNREFRACWRWKGRFEINSESEEGSARLKVCFAAQLDRTRFQDMLRAFLNGQRIILDVAGLAPELAKKLQLFLTENALPIQEINFLTPVKLVRLGEGLLLLFDGRTLTQHPAPKKLAFWEHVTRYLNLRHLVVKTDDELFYCWKTRLSSAHELNYDEVRRISFYNPLPRSVRCHLSSSKQFAFLKVVDALKGQAKSTPMGIDVELQPQGSLSLDFGHFEG